MRAELRAIWADHNPVSKVGAHESILMWVNDQMLNAWKKITGVMEMEISTLQSP